MALATVNQRVWDANSKTVADYFNFMETILVSDLGFAIYDANPGTIDGTTLNKVYSFTYNSLATKGTLYIRIIQAASQLNYRMYSSWNTSTKVGGDDWGASYGNAIPSLTDGTSVIHTIYNHPEVKFISSPIPNQPNNFLGLGFIRPANKPTWWSENVDLYAFFYSTSSASEFEFRTCRSNYLGNASFELNLFPSNGDSADIFQQLPNPYTARYPVISAPYVFSDVSNPSTRGCVGQFSSDIIIGNSPGLNTIVQINGKTTRYRFCTNIRSNQDAALGLKILD